MPGTRLVFFVVEAHSISHDFALLGAFCKLLGFRENCDLAILFRMHSIGQVEGCCENFLGHLDKKTAKNCLDEAVWKDEQTGQRQFLAVDMSGNSPLDHMLYAGQAKDPGPFRFGCPEWWENVDGKKK